MSLELLDHDDSEQESSTSKEKQAFSPLQFGFFAILGMVILWFCIGFVLLNQFDSRTPRTALETFMALLIPGLFVYFFMFSLLFSSVMCGRLKYAIWISILWIVPPPFLLVLALLGNTGRFTPSTTGVQVIGTLLIGLLFSVVLGSMGYFFGKKMSVRSQ